MDELIRAAPEPCETCDTGIGSLACFDGKYRCRNCVHQYAHELGWDEPPVADEEILVPEVVTGKRVKPEVESLF